LRQSDFFLQLFLLNKEKVERSLLSKGKNFIKIMPADNKKFFSNGLLAKALPVNPLSRKSKSCFSRILFRHS
jgi:hypothetical protein